MKYTLFRDDDISVTTDIGLLMKTHDMIVSHGKVHTVAVLMEKLWENKEVWLFLCTATNLQVGLHGWTHRDYGAAETADAIRDIQDSLAYWTHHTAAYPMAPKITHFYPPWNKTGPALEVACKICGLTLDVRWKKDTEVYGFHSWEMFLPERWAKLERALRDS